MGWEISLPEFLHPLSEILGLFLIQRRQYKTATRRLLSWVTLIWSLSVGVSLTLGAIHFAVWLQDRKIRDSTFVKRR